MSTSKKICAQCGEEYGAEQRFCPKDGSPLRPVGGDDPLIGQVLADRYQILDVIGEGGMGRVYLAEHVRMGRRSALKVINPSLSVSAEAISRFNREASNASRINHPNVAQIYDFGETPDGMLYLAMEFIEGETLTTIIEREGAIPLGQAGQIAKQISDGLAAAHHLGIVHRDLKPDNIMVGRHVDGSDWVKVVDFGIAKTMQGNSGDAHAPSQTVTTAGVSLGTPEYMSPEQLAGERLDARTDIYSLGLVVFNMLTADLPYPRVTSKETLIRRLTSPPRTLAEVRPEVAWPPALQIALSRALSPEVDDRFPSVAEFGQAIVMATAGAIDPGKTVRISSVSGMAAVRASSAMAGPGQTRQLSEPAAKRGRGVLVGATVGVLAMAGAAFALLHQRQASTGTNQSTPVAVGSDSVHQLADSLPAKAPLPGGAAAKTAPHVAPSSVGASADAQSTPTSTAGATAKKGAEPVSGKPASDTAPSTNVSASGTVAVAAADSGSRVGGAGGVNRAGARQGRRGAGNGGVGVNGRGPGRSAAAGASPQEHVWAAPQDTAAGFSKGAQDSIRVKAASDEINQHLADIVRLVQNGRINMVRSEVSDVQEDIRLVTSMFADVPGTTLIRAMVKARKVELLNGCISAFAAKPAVFPPTFSVNNCNGLFSSLSGGPGGL